MKSYFTYELLIILFSLYEVGNSSHTVLYKKMNSKIQLRIQGEHVFGEPVPLVKICAVLIGINHICFKEGPHLVVAQ